MPSALFRNVASCSDAIHGTSSLRTLGWSTVTWLFACSIAAALVYGMNASYARKQGAMGLLVPQAGVVRMSAPRIGVLTEVFVANGAVVEEGAPLFSVDFRQTLRDGGTLEASIQEALERQETLLNEQITSEQTRAAGDMVRLDSQTERLTNERAILDQQLEVLERRVLLTRERFEAAAGLRGSGIISETDFRAREEAWLILRQEHLAAEQRRIALEGELRGTQVARQQLPLESADRQARLRASLADMAQQQVQAEGQAEQIVRAPVAGRVTAVQGVIGQRLDPARPVLTLLPAGEGLHADLFVSSRAIGFLQPGQAVRLMYDAFPFQRFGTHSGVIETISQTMLSPDEIMGPVRPQEPAYRVRVALDQQTVAAFGRELPLQPDMTLRADILLEPRTVLEWLLEPLISAKGRM